MIRLSVSETARERSREQISPLSVARLLHGDAVPQLIVHAFPVAVRYRGERRKTCYSSVRPVAWANESAAAD